MPSPIEIIKRGIQEQDWSLVNEGYTNLTGEDLLSVVEEIVEKPKKRGRPKKEELVEPAKKQRGRPKKVEAVVVQPRRPSNSTKVVTKSRSSEEEKKEARTQQVQVGKKPQFFNN